MEIINNISNQYEILEKGGREKILGKIYKLKLTGGWEDEEIHRK